MIAGVEQTQLRKTLMLVVLSVFASWISQAASSNDVVQFNRDVRPILSDTCFACHGFDANKRKANLRLDTAEGFTAVIEGRNVVRPRNVSDSELWRRVNSKDPKEVMPPPESGKKLTQQQIGVLGKWITQGAMYQKHWSFQPPAKPELPKAKQDGWARNQVDTFIIATLEEKGLAPSAEAPRETLVRRASLTLTGLPPTPAEVVAFLEDQRPDAYERMIEGLLASPRYGEHMARYWLDAARYGDTHGLHLDNERATWAYRDWVVGAFNNNLRFDEFTVWQLAGDLLPNPSRDQLVASGFNRCNVSTSEGGAIDEEFQARYAVDRVETTSTVWMGLTMGCAVCHDHKLDPITQKEFYQVFSIFNNIAENAMDGNALLPPPTVQLPTPEQEKRLAELDEKTQGLQSKAKKLISGMHYVDPAAQTNAPKPPPTEKQWFEDDFPAKAEISVNSGNEPSKWIETTEGPVFSGKRSLLRAGAGLHQVFFPNCAEPLTISRGKLFAHVYLDATNPPKAVMLQFYRDGWNHRAIWGDADAIPYGAKGTPEKFDMGPLPPAGKWTRLEVDPTSIGLRAGTQVTGVAFTQFDGRAYWDKLGIISINDPAEDPELSLTAWLHAESKLGDKSTAPKEIKALLKTEPDKADAEQQEKLREHFLTSVYSHPQLAPVRTEMKSLREQREALEKEIPSTMVSKELEKPRPTWVLVRGDYDKKGEAVGPGVPAVLPALPQGEVTNRLTFARWLVDPRHPLTARVTVNRFWQQLFGTGLVKTGEDFGTKGEWPSHPELLDWLATEFMKEWDVKGLMRLLVNSATFRQSSRVTPRLQEIDPENRLLARGPRFRLDAEVLRDEALYVSGLLQAKAGGRGTRTYQPPGIWEAVGYTTSNTAKYTQDHGEALYCRSLYLFWKRTAPPPMMTTFDAPSREKCVVRRERTNTPLQALLTMNDIQYFEAARHLGYRLLKEAGPDDAERLRYGFTLVTSRKPSDAEMDVLKRMLSAQRQRYTSDPEAAKKTVAVGESPVPTDVPAPELAAYSLVANLLLNLDEAVTIN